LPVGKNGKSIARASRTLRPQGKMIPSLDLLRNRLLAGFPKKLLKIRKISFSDNFLPSNNNNVLFASRHYCCLFRCPALLGLPRSRTGGEFVPHECVHDWSFNNDDLLFILPAFVKTIRNKNNQ
jgi:hypothetical protein